MRKPWLWQFTDNSCCAVKYRYKKVRSTSRLRASRKIVRQKRNIFIPEVTKRQFVQSEATQCLAGCKCSDLKLTHYSYYSRRNFQFPLPSHAQTIARNLALPEFTWLPNKLKLMLNTVPPQCVQSGEEVPHHDTHRVHTPLGNP